MYCATSDLRSGVEKLVCSLGDGKPGDLLCMLWVSMLIKVSGERGDRSVALTGFNCPCYLLLEMVPISFSSGCLLMLRTSMTFVGFCCSMFLGMARIPYLS